MKLLSVCSILHTLQMRILHLGHIFPEGDFSNGHASRGAFSFLEFFLWNPLFFSSKTRFLSRGLKGERQNSDQNKLWQIFTVNYNTLHCLYEITGSILTFSAKGRKNLKDAIEPEDSGDEFKHACPSLGQLLQLVRACICE